jgi:hypothetical protein
MFTAGQLIFLQVKSHILFLPNNLVTLSGSSAGFGDLFDWNSIPSWSSSDENRKSNNLIAHFDGSFGGAFYTVIKLMSLCH